MEPTISSSQPTPAPAPSPAFQPPYQASSGFSMGTLFVGLFFGIALAGFGVFYYLNYYKNTNLEVNNVPMIESNILNSLVATSTNEAPSTVTYTNTKYGYSFNYPYNWIMESEKSDPVNDSIVSTYADNKEGTPRFSVEISSIAPSLFFYDAPIKEDILIQGRKYIAYVFPKGYECYESYPYDDCSFFVILIKKGDLWYTLRATGYAKNVTSPYKEILESFKFNTQQNNTVSLITGESCRYVAPNYPCDKLSVEDSQREQQAIDIIKVAKASHSSLKQYKNQDIDKFSLLISAPRYVVISSPLKAPIPELIVVDLQDKKITDYILKSRIMYTSPKAFLFYEFPTAQDPYVSSYVFNTPKRTNLPSPSSGYKYVLDSTKETWIKSSGPMGSQTFGILATTTNTITLGIYDLNNSTSDGESTFYSYIKKVIFDFPN